MESLIWFAIIVFSIYAVWHFGNKIAGFSIVGFWIFWTLGLSSLFVGYTLSGPLATFQLVVIIIAFFISYQIRNKRNKAEKDLKLSKDIITNLRKDLKRLDNNTLSNQINSLSLDQIEVLENPKAHRKKLLDTLDNAQRTIVIFSGWVTDFSVTSEFRLKLKECLNRGVDIIIAWGYKKSRGIHITEDHVNKAERSIRELQEWTSLNNTKGILQTFYFPNHSKILICDDKYAVMGSFNWLSNSGGSENEERSYIIYNRDFIKKELVEITKNLFDPAKPHSRRKFLKNFVPFSRY
ncbi:MAG: phospholipase D-like domain-containing protein [Candidatus Woesearchaeota archaeon]